MKQPDQLILAMQEGNEKAFARIYSRYSKALFGVINTIVDDTTISEELLQDVFVKIWNKASQFDTNKGRFFTWALNIARNTAIDYTRSKASKNAKKNLSTTNFVDIIKHTDTSLQKTTDTIGLRSFIEKLSPVCIKIIDLLYYKGYTQKDASETLEMPLGTIKTKNRNCIKELQKTLNLD